MRSIRFAAFFVVSCICNLSALAQIRQIDRTKLPQEPAVQEAYNDLLPIDQYARTFEATWRFPIPKAEVTARFTSALHVLEQAQKQAPSNLELELFTGLVAHLTYNLDVEEAYQPALELLQSLQNAASPDYRSSWFLGMHQCQSNNVVGGMQNLLHVETSPSDLPSAFWQDYANCASVTTMPVHAVRAYDLARKAGGDPPIDTALENIARNRIKPSSIQTTYPKTTAWSAQATANHVLFTSTLCGESFATKPTSHLNITDVSNGTCAVTIQTDQHPNRHGSSSASLLLLTQPAKSDETLEDFSKRYLNKPQYTAAKPILGLPCPVKTCLAFEIVTNNLYPKEGGAHLLALFFASEEPLYPGLRLEFPHTFSKPDPAKASKEPTFFRPVDPPQRFSGTLYTLAALDANQDIYDHSRVDFEELLKSLVVDSK